MLVGDPHENERVNTKEERNKVQDYLALQYAAVQELKPDLIILMGDNATASTEEGLRNVLLRITEPYRVNNIPFAFVLGNHDLECNVSDLHTQYNVYRSIPGCLLPDEENVSENGDYYVTVSSSSDNKDILNFWLMYSGNKAEAKYNSRYDFVKGCQLEWYKNNAEKLSEKNGGLVPAVVFQHIPVPEEYQLLDKVSPLAILTNGVRGQVGQEGSYYRLKKGVRGYLGEGICPSDYNSGEFQAWKNTGDVFAAFFGHDHLNDFVGEVDGITLGQCKLSGFRQYGDGLRQGVRILDFTEDNVRAVATEMVYYRDLIGNECASITGLNLLPDRITTKIDVVQNVFPFLKDESFLFLNRFFNK